jgi:hypothetical protein
MFTSSGILFSVTSTFFEILNKEIINVNIYEWKVTEAKAIITVTTTKQTNKFWLQIQVSDRFSLQWERINNLYIKRSFLHSHKEMTLQTTSGMFLNLYDGI